MSTRHHLLTTAAGIRHDWIQDGDEFRIESTQEVDGILDLNQAMANHNDGYSPTRDLRRVGSIPFGLILQWRNDEGWDALDPDNQDRLARKLNDIDFFKLRTAPGRIGISNGSMR